MLTTLTSTDRYDDDHRHSTELLWWTRRDNSGGDIALALQRLQLRLLPATLSHTIHPGFLPLCLK